MNRDRLRNLIIFTTGVTTATVCGLNALNEAVERKVQQSINTQNTLNSQIEGTVHGALDEVRTEINGAETEINILATRIGHIEETLGIPSGTPSADVTPLSQDD